MTRKLRRRRSSRRPEVRRNPTSSSEMARGIEHEFEHTDDPTEAAAIACDHLEEMPDYYTRLEAMEDRARAGLAPNGLPGELAMTLLDDEHRIIVNGSPDERYMDTVGSLVQNRARALGDRPSMDTRFGDDLDDEDIDSIGGAEGRALDAAMDRYRTFHAKDPIRIAELKHDLPTHWKEVGDALAVMYRTDKWKRDGTDEDYKHLHDAGDDKPYDIGKGVRIYEPVRGRGRSLPVARPQALTLLGYCLGVFVRKDDDGEIYEANPRGCYLFSSPSGNMLAIYSPEQQPDGSSGFLAVMAGGKLRVLKDGIDG